MVFPCSTSGTVCLLSTPSAQMMRYTHLFGAKIIDRLVVSAEGKSVADFLFLHRVTNKRYADFYLQLDYILHPYMPRKVISALDNLPTSMSAAYGEILERISQTGEQDTVIRILSWIFHAERPLKMQQLREVVSIESTDTELMKEYFLDPVDIVRSCQSLVEFDENSGIVCFIHYTVLQFLKDKFQEKLLSPLQIAKVCLTYLNFYIFDVGPCCSRREFEEQMKAYQFSDYVVQYWGRHVKGDGEEDDEVLDAFVQVFQFLKKACWSASASVVSGTVCFVRIQDRPLGRHFTSLHRRDW